MMHKGRMKKGLSDDPAVLLLMIRVLRGWF